MHKTSRETSRGHRVLSSSFIQTSSDRSIQDLVHGTVLLCWCLRACAGEFLSSLNYSYVVVVS